MPAPKNRFKEALAAGKPQIGLWLGLADPYVAGLCAGAGFDWLVVDGEHGPNDLRSTLAALTAIGDRSHGVVRPPIGEIWLIKQLLDIGAQTLLIPMIESVAEAERMVAAVRYPPKGRRGVGAFGRAADFGRIRDYVATADAEICLLLQVESRAGLAALPGILELEGVDGVFIGPADLAADMGFPGTSGQPEVLSAIEAAITEIVAAGKAAGILTFDRTLAERYLALGATFVAIGTDVGTLVSGVAALRASVGA
ncbi:HpcH/HpaI aldolase/citrate lyase family protein [Frigidibacter sp. SD6-1]|uniref:HpcH/HpaI aldolase/citrate lyase family protein n=1 Tax=Frigidibacter sp. SD6-1 TaxID=3032581 RepID=UPI0024DFDCD7|nr:HpcH/HpaI aldolase/citrate lyase family protein [Frigidibacter sp. SD6-1]